jgi:aryl-alcohol dehydrogenase-like predicted oxidoreductase
MEHTRLGKTGLKISRLALGCMSYGDPDGAGAHRWALNDDQAQPFFEQAVELGITFCDTANTYQAGTSEEVVGRAIKRYSCRVNIIVATKVYGRMHDGPAVMACPARRSSSRSMPPSPGSAPTTSTCTRSTASTRTPRSRRPWRCCTTS